jgi:MFS family permease
MISDNKLISDVDSKSLQQFDNNENLKLEDVTPKLTKMWFRYPHLLKLNIYLLSAIFACITYGYDSSMMGNLQTLPSWSKYFNNPSGDILSTMNNGVSIGALGAIPFAGFINDRFGRKTIIIVGTSLTILGSALQAGAINYGMFLAARIILGFGVCLSSAGAGPLLTETAYPSQRPAMTSFLYASFLVGSFLAALFTWGPYISSMKYSNWSWRLPSLLQALFPAIELILAIVGPESPRWLIANEQYDKAFEVLTKYHAGGDTESPLVKFEMAEISAAIDKEKLGKQFTWNVWFKTKANMHRLFLSLVVPSMQQLCGSSLTAYYFPIVLDNIGITEPVEKLKINLGLTVYGLAWSLTFASMCGKLKRRNLFITSYLCMCLMFIIWIVLSAFNEQMDFKNKAIGRAIIAIIYFHFGFYHMSSPIGTTYVMEIVPYALRSKASTLYQMCTNGWILFNNYVNNLGMDAIQWRYYIVFCVWLAIQATIVYLFFPETFGLGLEEMAQVFGEDISDMQYVADKTIVVNQSEAHVLKSSVYHIEDKQLYDSMD